MEDERAGCLREPLVSFSLLFSSPCSQRTPEAILSTPPLRLAHLQILEAGLVGWLGHVRNLFLNNIFGSVIISHLDLDPISG